ncbi:hypothetical protein AB0G55_31875 [Streptomyces toyocaensis]|nr:hypothetical protein [Streptomyces toyocaensis]
MRDSRRARRLLNLTAALLVGAATGAGKFLGGAAATAALSFLLSLLS